MKRYRAVDAPPKFRRTVKGRSARLGESVYFNRFFSAYNLVYLKFFLMWLGCITLDFLIGFRFELLWPLWLLVRHLYESFRIHAFSSSLQYSAFSVFFVCVTATSDLVCYLFIPIQVLIFLASTYVWVQFVYQSSADRGICLPSLFLWALFIIFEYSVRYRFDNATWYLTRTSWVTAGLFPSTADSVSVGTPPTSTTSSASSTRLELYRPFAAHCIGFPVVTLGFRAKSLFSNWRMRIRRDEVRRQNEFYERILADSLPASFENRKHFISTRSHFSIEQQEAFDFDSGGGFATTELLNGLEGPSQSTRLCSNGTSFAAICAAPVSSSVSVGSTTASSSLLLSSPSSATATLSALLKKQQRLCKQNAVSTSAGALKQQNGSLVGSSSKRNGIANGAVAKYNNNFNNNNNNSGTTLMKVHKLLRNVFRLCCLFVLSTFGHLLSSLTPSLQQTLERLLSQLRGVTTNQQVAAAQGGQDDLISTSGDGSNAAEEEEWERDSNHYQAVHSDSQTNLLQGGKRRARRPRGLSTLSSTSTATIEQQQHHQAKTPTTSSTCSFGSSNLNAPPPQNGDLLLPASSVVGISSSSLFAAGDGCVVAENGEQIRENEMKLSELKNLQRQKQSLEQSMEKLKNELKASRHGEGDLRSQLTAAQQQEQNTRNEWRQYEREQKQKLEQFENKCRQLGKQNEHFKTNIQALEKRVGELQLKKLEIERELANERLMKQQLHMNDHSSRQHAQENGEQLKQKLINMDRELKQMKREMKAKDDSCSKLDEEVKRLRATKSDEIKQMEVFRQKNFLLEQTLSAENRLKQDLFRALNDSKAEIASIKAQLRAKTSKEQAEMMSAFNSGAGNALFSGGTTKSNSTEKDISSSGSSPVQLQHQQQYSHLTSQKSLTPPPLSVASSTLNLESLLQATQNMSYSLGPIDSTNGGDNLTSGEKNSYSNCVTSSPYLSKEASEMLAVGGHRGTAAGGGGSSNANCNTNASSSTVVAGSGGGKNVGSGGGH